MTMSPQENILDKKLNGVTIKVAAAVLGSALVLGWNGYGLYSNILTEIRINNEKFNAIEQQMRSIKETSDRHEQQIQFLINNQIKHKEL